MSDILLHYDAGPAEPRETTCWAALDVLRNGGAPASELSSELRSLGVPEMEITTRAWQVTGFIRWLEAAERQVGFIGTDGSVHHYGEARASRREEALGLRLPDPVVAFNDDGDPEREAILADSVGAALLVVLDTLTPAERLAFVLHDTFGLPFEELGRILERTPTAGRQLASRARRRVRGAPAAPDAPPGRQRELVDAFLRAAREGDFAALLRVLDPEAVVRAETDERVAVLGGSCIIRGADAVAREALGFGRLAPGAHHATVNGTPGLVVFAGNAPFAVLGFRVRGDRIVEIDILAAPERLRGLGLRPPG